MSRHQQTTSERHTNIKRIAARAHNKTDRSDALRRAKRAMDRDTQQEITDYLKRRTA